MVAGAGVGGLMAALTAAEGGLSVLLLEKRSQKGIGNPWVCGVEREIFTRVGLRAPVGDEVHRKDSNFRMRDPMGGEVSLARTPLFQISMRPFTQRLLATALERRVDLMEQATVSGSLLKGEKVVGVNVNRRGKAKPIKAPLIIDATGIDAAVHSGLYGVERPEPGDVIDAWQEVRDIDVSLAREAVRAGLIRDKEELATIGIHGGYSVEMVTLDLKHGTADILTGVNLTEGISAKEMALLAVKRHPFMRRRLFGGGGHIAVGMPISEPVKDGLMIVGDAARQVVSQHSSGVASALLAGKLAGEVAVKTASSGRSDKEFLWEYPSRFLRERGGMLAVSELTRRTIDSLNPADVNRLIRSGLISPRILNASLNGLPAFPGPREFLSFFRRTSNLGLLPKILPLTLDGSRAIAAYHAFPAYPILMPIWRTLLLSRRWKV